MALACRVHLFLQSCIYTPHSSHSPHDSDPATLINTLLNLLNEKINLPSQELKRCGQLFQDGAHSDPSAPSPAEHINKEPACQRGRLLIREGRGRVVFQIGHSLRASSWTQPPSGPRTGPDAPQTGTFCWLQAGFMVILHRSPCLV